MGTGRINGGVDFKMRVIRVLGVLRGIKGIREVLIDTDHFRYE
jgi:hypothetical protein